MSSDKESAKSHSQRNPVRVLVRTLPLGNNYGNILQCYALQRALQQLGAQVATDVTQSKDGRSSVPPSWSTDLKHALIRFGISRPEWAASGRPGPAPLRVEAHRYLPAVQVPGLH